MIEIITEWQPYFGIAETTKNNKTVIIQSMDEYNRTHAQIKKDVKEALSQAEKGDLLDIDDTFSTVLAKYED